MEEQARTPAYDMAAAPECGENQPFNMAWMAVDRHAAGDAADRAAFRCVHASGEIQTVDFQELKTETDRFAAYARRMGIRRGDCVAVLCPRVPELYFAALGAMKAGAMFCPLYYDLGPEPLRKRLHRSGARLLVTTEQAYIRKIADIRSTLPRLSHILLLDGALSAHDIRQYASLPYPPTHSSASIATCAEDSAFLQFTSGTSGIPKAAVHVHDALRFQTDTGRSVLGLTPDDVYWCTADPGWVTGTVYGMIVPLALAVPIVVYAGDFDASAWLDVLVRQGVTVWYTSPTALRWFMRFGEPPRVTHDLSRLKRIYTVGEPLSAELIRWGETAFGVPVLDTWWQTETGAIMIANTPATPVRPGAMGRPVPGVHAAVLATDEDGRVSGKAPIGDIGQLAIRTGWPSMFREYLNDPERYRRRFSSGWYLSGDLARQDEDGYFWFVGRSDDVIKTAGHLVGPFEVESVVNTHPAVLESGVVGVPEPLLGERIVACVVLKSGVVPDSSLNRDLLAYARQHLGTAIAPREIRFVATLPKNAAGKILRRNLKSNGMQPEEAS